ncbi:MAG: hypothetical protein ACLRWQ_02410 [Flavonifractor plautii]
MYDKVTHAMALLKQHHLPFGISACYTSVNYKDITSEKFYDLHHGSAALPSVWFFHHMPVGNDAATRAAAQPQSSGPRSTAASAPCRQTKARSSAMWTSRTTPSIGGCTAGGRRYLHINANGDVDPCVFIHYS